MASKGAAQDAKPDEQNLNSSEKEDSKVSYEVSKSVRKIVEPFGDIKRISLAVLVDGKYEKVKGKKGEELKYIPRSQQELDNIKNLVVRAAGFNEERGDKIEVLNMPFEVETFPEDKSLFGSPENKDLVMNLGKYVFYSVMLLCIFLFFLRPLFRMFQKKEEPLTTAQVQDVYLKAGGEAAPALAGIEKPQPQTPIAEALKDKALVGSIIREWVRESP